MACSVTGGKGGYGTLVGILYNGSMLALDWHWWLNSDGGLAARIGIGVTIFACLAAVDWRRNGREARRWREYVFVLAAVAAAMGYSLVNDQVTATISWEYFYYGKELDAQLGPQTPPDQWALRVAVAKVGLKATWTAGLLFGVALLVANNPSKKRAQLPYTRLYRLLPMALLMAGAGAILLGIAGYLGWLGWCNRDFSSIEIFRPFRFMCVFGVHLGGYIGGLVAMVIAIIWIIRQRRRMV